MTTTTTSAYERSHGHAPRGQWGMWAFQRTTTRVAFDGDLYGKVRTYTGHYGHARKRAEFMMHDAPFVAVLP